MFVLGSIKLGILAIFSDRDLLRMLGNMGIDEEHQFLVGMEYVQKKRLFFCNL